MRDQLLRAFVGLGFGCGIWFALRGLLLRPVPLASAVSEFRRPRLIRSTSVFRQDHPPGAFEQRIAPFALRTLEAMGIDLGGVRRDLRISHRTAEEFAFSKLMGALAGAAAPLLAVGVLVAAGFRPGAWWVPFACMIGAALGFLLPDIRLKERAALRRKSFLHALAAFLDLTKVLIAGGGHVEGALYSAALAGEGWAFGEILSAIDWARTTGHPAWMAFDRLADEIDVRELRELAASLALADQEGAPPGVALSRKSEMMTAHQMFEARAEAESATEQMSVPTVLIAMAFLVWLGAPAIASLLEVTRIQ